VDEQGPLVRPLGLLALRSRLPRFVRSPAAPRSDRERTNGHRTQVLPGRKARPCKRRPELRILGLALAGALALTAPIAVHSASLRSNIGPAIAGPVPGVLQVGDGHGSNWHPTPHVGGGGWRSPHSGPSRFNSSPYWGPGVPNYYVWVPGSAVFDYPFQDWQGPTGGWGNP